MSKQVIGPKEARVAAMRAAVNQPVTAREKLSASELGIKLPTPSGKKPVKRKRKKR